MANLLQISAKSLTDEIASFFAFVKQAFVEFKPTDALDILILALFFAVAFKFLKGRKSGALIIGIMVCLTVLALSTALNLTGTRYILSSLFKIGALLIVIIFQPEIREALERLGNGSIHGIMSIGDQKHKKFINYATVDAVCSAVRELSSSNTGALIVITRTTQFEDIINTGVTINADVNSYLLRNLFFNKAPLHDGAVIIDDGRIAAAGCLLPLTRRTDVDSDLGTRHRAALGMSEVSDAITVIVSEETGIISVAYDCALTRNFTPESLRKFLLHKILNEHSEDETN